MSEKENTASSDNDKRCPDCDVTHVSGSCSDENYHPIRLSWGDALRKKPTRRIEAYEKFFKKWGSVEELELFFINCGSPTEIEKCLDGATHFFVGLESNGWSREMVEAYVKRNPLTTEVIDVTGISLKISPKLLNKINVAARNERRSIISWIENVICDRFNCAVDGEDLGNE